MSRSKPKLLIANRGEIAVRIFAAAHELDLPTVAIYTEEDSLSGHKQKADEAYLIGGSKKLSPVEKYLQGDEIIAIAKSKGVHHPGYGFLSENAQFARAVRDAGMVFIGPSYNIIAQMADKVAARDVANRCGVAVVPGSERAVQEIEDALDFAHKYGFPILIKAALGGGGRGMRVVREHDMLGHALEEARSEALAAFGDSSVFVEKYLERPKHIEVQILGDSYGNIVHLFERDCSIQRRHQKIIEIAPSPTLSDAIRKAIIKAAVKIATHVKYENAGTIEFLVEKDNFYFIEMNPRIQVEHTITEVITGIDIVKSQIQVALGESLQSLELVQDRIFQHGYAIQCRVTTEDPNHDFRPDSGTLEACRIPTSYGTRIDYSGLFQGRIISPFYDSLLLKSTTGGSTLEMARKTALRALAELRIRGVKTNVDFLASILQTEEFVNGACWTTFIDDCQHLLLRNRSQNRAQKFLKFLADTAVNGSMIVGQMRPPGYIKSIQTPILEKPTEEHGWRKVLLEHGPHAFAQQVRDHPTTLLTDTTWRDGQQSLLATRVRERDLTAIAPYTSHAFANAYSLECWGGATFDVAMRFLYEDPWERLRKLRERVPNIPFQMLLRSTNGVAYSALPDNAIYHFVKLAKDNGIDIFRVFDGLNDISNLAVGIKAALQAGAVVEGAILYTGDMLKGSKYSLEYYIGLVDNLVQLGSHVIAIKSMSGVMKPEAGRRLVCAIRTKYPNIPIHMHTHDTNGAGVATMVACVEAGADIVDTAIDSLSGSTSQPAMSATIAALEHTGMDLELDLDQVAAIDTYWAQLRLLYAGFDANLHSPDPTVYKHEIPGGQYSNLLFQARQLGLGDKWKQTRRAYEDANLLLGDIVKATPTSKAVGDLAQFMVDQNLSRSDVIERASSLDFPASVLDFFQGLMGQPFDGFPEPLRTQALRGQRQKMAGRPGLDLAPLDFEAIREEISTRFHLDCVPDQDISSYIMYPDVYAELRSFRDTYGDLTNLDTPTFFTTADIGQKIHFVLEEGKDLVAEMVCIGSLNALLGTREVLFRLNGELRSVYVADKAAAPTQTRKKIDVSCIADIGAPMAGRAIRLGVKNGDYVTSGDIVMTLSAMKMEINVSVRREGVIHDLDVKVGDQLEKDDLVMRVLPV